MKKLTLICVRFLANLMANLKFRGKDRMLETICPHVSEAPVSLFGFRVNLDLTDHIQRKMFLNTDWADTRTLRENVKGGMTVFDVGCNVGAYTLLASSLVGSQGKVYAFEPNPSICQRLANVLKQNAITNVRLFNYGIGDSKCQLTLFPNTQSGNATATLVADGQGNGFIVQIETIDNIVAAENVAQIDYIKIDVDGFEPNVFKGATQTLREKKIKFIQSEFCDYWLKRNGSSPLKLYQNVIENGFRDLHGAPHFPDGVLTDCFFEQNQ